MVFSSAISLFFFVPIVFLLDRRLSDVDAKNTWLLLASLVFYSFGQVYYLPLLLASVALNYVCGRLAAGKYAKLGVTLAVIGGIGLLAVFKYADFAIRTVNALCGLHLPLTGIALPIGISFFTFQGLSYVIDVYREPKMVTHSFKKVLLYIAFFPQLIAGPIVKYHDVEQEIDSRRTTPQETALGIRRFICGLSKKLLLSNALGQMADTVFALPAGEIGMLAGWTGAICYTLQIYFDFSGYSDMALGLGLLLAATAKEGLYPCPVFNRILGIGVNLLRSVPFIILLVWVMPITRAVMGTTIGSKATLVPLIIASAPFIARMVESSVREVDQGVVEAALSMGASPLQILLRVLLLEAKPSLITGAAIALTTILGYSAMAGIVGGGGLGAIAINYGYYRFNVVLEFFATALLVVLVQILQTVGTKLAIKCDKRIQK